MAGISGCGGYGLTPQHLMRDVPGFEYEGGYCTAEVLYFRYDHDAETLMLLDQRALLNCCGHRRVELSWDEGTLVVTEVDEPEPGGGRCDCLCVFDFAVELWAGVDPDQPLDLRLVRRITDTVPLTETELWSGTIDLAQGRGLTATGDTPGEPWCTEPVCGDACQEFCSASCSNRGACVDPEASFDLQECQTECQAEGARTAEAMKADFLELATQCLAQVGCGSDDACLGDALLAVAPDLAADADHQRCLVAHEQCDFSDDMCFFMFAFEGRLFQEMVACLDLPCEEIGSCLRFKSNSSY